MKKLFIRIFLLLFVCGDVIASNLKSIRDFNVNPGNSSNVSKVTLQKAIDCLSVGIRS